MQLQAGCAYIGKGDADVVVARRPSGLVALPVRSDANYPWHPSADRLVKTAMEQIAPDAEIVNGSMFMRVLRTMVLGVALADHPPANADEPQWPPQAATS